MDYGRLLENSVKLGHGRLAHSIPPHPPPAAATSSVPGLMISNAAKHYGAVKAPLFTGDAAANLPSHVPFVDFCETTTRRTLISITDQHHGELSQSLSPNALLAAIPFCLPHPPTGSR